MFFSCCLCIFPNTTPIGSALNLLISETYGDHINMDSREVWEQVQEELNERLNDDSLVRERISLVFDVLGE